MSYPALMEKPDTDGPTGGANAPEAEGGGGGGLVEEVRGGTEGEAVGGKGELLVKGEESVAGGGKWEERGGGADRGLLKAGREGTGGRAAETEGETELVPGGDKGLDRPMLSGGALTEAATLRGGVGLAGGVVSIPLSSIIFLALNLLFSPEYSC